MILPSRRALAKEFGVDLNTLQRAIAPLLADGTLVADAGRATFVATKPSLAFAPTQTYEPLTEPKRRMSVQGGRVGIVAQFSIQFSQYAQNTDAYAMVGTIERSLAPHGITTTVADVSELGRRDIRQVDAMRTLLDLGVDAIIDTTHLTSESAELARSLRIPTVFLGSEPTHERVAHVSYDNHDAGSQAAIHLLDKGCRHLLYFSSRSAKWVELRHQGARSAVANYGDSAKLTSFVGEELMPEHDLDQVQDAYELSKQRFQSFDGLDGIIAANDSMALGYMLAAAEFGQRAPEDYMLVGFDDDPHITTKSGITSLRRPFEQMAGEAAALVLRGLAGDRIDRYVQFFTELIPRNTTYRRQDQISDESQRSFAGTDTRRYEP